MKFVIEVLEGSVVLVAGIRGHLPIPIHRSRVEKSLGAQGMGPACPIVPIPVETPFSFHSDRSAARGRNINNQRY